MIEMQDTVLHDAILGVVWNGKTTDLINTTLNGAITVKDTDVNYNNIHGGSLTGAG